MDQFIDNLAKELAKPTSRRGVMRLIGGAVFGGLVAAWKPASLEAQVCNPVCTAKKPKCCAGNFCVESDKTCCGSTSCVTATKKCCPGPPPFCATIGKQCCGKKSCKTSVGEFCCNNTVCCTSKQACGPKGTCVASKVPN